MKTHYTLSPIPEIHTLKLQQWKRLSKLAVKRLRLKNNMDQVHPVTLIELAQGMQFLEDEITSLKISLYER